MTKTQSEKPLLRNTVLSSGQSRYYVSEDAVRILLERGCGVCGDSFRDSQIIDLSYDTSDLYVIGLSISEVAGIRIGFFASLPPSGEAREVYIIDRKMAVCLKCYIEYLKGILELKGKK